MTPADSAPTPEMKLRAPLLPGWLRWVIVVGLAAFIFYVSIVTAPPETIIDERPEFIPLDKWRHFVAYAALGFALAYATTDWGLATRRVAVFVIGTTVLYGIGIEVGQSFMPRRSLSIADAYANALGGVLVVPWYLIRPHVEFVSLGSFVETVTDASR